MLQKSLASGGNAQKRNNPLHWNRNICISRSISLPSSFHLSSAFILKQIFRKNGSLRYLRSPSVPSSLFCGMHFLRGWVSGDSILITSLASISRDFPWKKFCSSSAYHTRACSAISRWITWSKKIICFCIRNSSRASWSYCWWSWVSTTSTSFTPAWLFSSRDCSWLLVCWNWECVLWDAFIWYSLFC